jgi:hypothetical protein
MQVRFNWERSLIFDRFPLCNDLPQHLLNCHGNQHHQCVEVLLANVAIFSMVGAFASQKAASTTPFKASTAIWHRNESQSPTVAAARGNEITGSRCRYRGKKPSGYHSESTLLDRSESMKILLWLDDGFQDSTTAATVLLISLSELGISDVHEKDTT